MMSTSLYQKRPAYIFSRKDLLEFMQRILDDSSLDYDQRFPDNDIFLYSPGYDVGYDPAMIMTRISAEVGQQISTYFTTEEWTTVVFI